MSSAWPPAWLTAAALAERWNAETVPQIKKTLDKLGVAELERRGDDVCVFGHCEPIEAGASLPVLAAVAKLLKTERKRRKAGQRQKPKRESDFAAVPAEEQLARVLGPGWAAPRLRATQRSRAQARAGRKLRPHLGRAHGRDRRRDGR